MLKLDFDKDRADQVPSEASPGRFVEQCREELCIAKSKDGSTPTNQQGIENFAAGSAKISPDFIDFGAGSEKGRAVEVSKEQANKKQRSGPTSEQIRAVYGDETGGPTEAPYPNYFVPHSVRRGDFDTLDTAEPPPSELLAAKAAKGEQVSLASGDVAGSIYVRQNSYMIADSNVPLKTSDLSTCTALLVTDGQKSYLAHIDGSESPEAIQKSLSGFDLNSDKLSVYMLPGKLADKSVDRIAQALKGTGALDMLRVVSWDPADKGMGPEQRRFITMHNGKIMRGNERLEQLF